MSSIRTFIAVDPSQQVRETLKRLMESLASMDAGYKWVPPNQLHLTLSFLGDVADRDIPELCRDVETALSDGLPFEMSLKSVSAFPAKRTPQIIWIGTGIGYEEIRLLHQNLGWIADRWSAKKERREYIPHLTLARLKKGRRPSDALLTELARLSEYSTGSFIVDKVIVYSSFLDRSGRSYAPMATIKLHR